jgi:hypothetical protein
MSNQPSPSRLAIRAGLAAPAATLNVLKAIAGGQTVFP